MSSRVEITSESYGTEVRTFLQVYQLDTRLREVAEAFGCSIPTLERLLSGETKPTAKTLQETKALIAITMVSNFEVYHLARVAHHQQSATKAHRARALIAGACFTAGIGAACMASKGLSAADITHALKILGALFGGGMRTGVAVVAFTPVVIGGVAKKGNQAFNRAQHEQGLHSKKIDPVWEFLRPQ